MTPSAKAATSAAWSPFETPSPTHTGSVGQLRGSGRPASRPRRDRGARARHAHGRCGVDEAAASPSATRSIRSSVDDGATRKIRSSPVAPTAASHGAGLVGGEVGRDRRRTPPAAARSRGEAARRRSARPGSSSVMTSVGAPASATAATVAQDVAGAWCRPPGRPRRRPGSSGRPSAGRSRAGRPRRRRRRASTIAAIAVDRSPRRTGSPAGR